MSESIGFENFRIFEKEVLIDLAPITILTGPNSSGKSSIIKAAKLLKQNIKSEKFSGLPITLSFTPDDLSHNLGSYDQIINRHSQSKDVSFTIPIKLDTLSDDFHCKVTYGKLDYGNHFGELTLKSISFLKGTENSVLFAKIKGSLGAFYNMEINPLLIKECTEEYFKPKLDNVDNSDDLWKSVPYSIREHYLQGKDLLDDLLTCNEKYCFKKPIMPWFNLFLGDKGLSSINYEKSDDPDIITRFQRIMDYYNYQIEIFAQKNNLGDLTEATLKFFIDIENDFFNFISDKKPEFPIDFSIENRDRTWWNGILINDYYDEDICTSVKTVEAILNYDSYLAELMYVYENIYSFDHNKEWQNFEFFTHYFQALIIESIEQCRSYINNFKFADLNKIEQVLLYSSTNSSTAFKILNDYLGSEKLVKSKIVEHLSKLQIAEDFVIEQGNGAYQINMLKQNSWVPLAEMGFGISKIFFFLLTLSAYKLVFIEEPESNLHPDLQSKLADILQSFSSSNTKFIIETHSEYLIRKLQYLVAINKIKKEDVLIHYFPSASNRQQSTQIKTIRIKRDGGIDGDFGAGFFDEAANIIKDLFNLTYYN